MCSLYITGDYLLSSYIVFYFRLTFTFVVGYSFVSKIFRVGVGIKFLLILGKKGGALGFSLVKDRKA